MGLARGTGLGSLLLLAACAAGGAGQVAAPMAAADPVYACQMRGAMAEDRVYGPFGTLDINSAIVRAEVTQACLSQARQAGVLPR